MAADSVNSQDANQTPDPLPERDGQEDPVRGPDGRFTQKGYRHRSDRLTEDEREELIVAAMSVIPAAGGDEYKVCTAIKHHASLRFKKKITRQSARNYFNKAKSRLRYALTQAIPDMPVYTYHKMLALYQKAEKENQFKTQTELLKLEVDLYGKLGIGIKDTSEFHGVEFVIRDPDESPMEDPGAGNPVVPGSTGGSSTDDEQGGV